MHRSRPATLAAPGRHICQARFTALSLVAAISALLPLAACRTVKPYQRIYLNDYNMQLGKTGIDKFDQSVQTYKEGASGGGNGKPSGGCGCN